MIGTQKQGVVRYDYPTDTFIRVPFNGEYKPFSVFTLCQVGDEIWVGCDGEGIRRYDIQHKQLEEYNPDISMFDYNHSRVHSVLEDRDKNIWIGICQKGVVFINHKHVHFDYMGRLSSYYNPIGYSCVRQILQDHQNHLWICNDNEGLFELDANGKQLRYLSTQSDGGYLPKKINSLFEDKDHQLWIGSTTQQVGILDRVSGKMRYKDDINIERVSAMAQDETGNMYYATFGSGMYRYDKQTGILQHFTAYKGDDASLRNEYLGNDWINALMIDSEGILWIAHYKGISCFNPQTGSFVNYGNSNILIPDCIGVV